MNCKSRTLNLVCLLTIVLCLTSISFGQSATGIIFGSVKDSSGAAVPGATVTATNPENAVTQTTVSGEDGSFSIPQVSPGTYTVTIEKDGFKKLEKTGVVVSAADRLNAGDFALEVGDVNAVVTVNAEEGQLQIKSESGERSDLINNSQINNLALNGRNILDLFRVVPGVASTVDGQVSDPSNQLNKINFNGLRNNQKELTIDGSSNVSTGNNGSLHVTVNPDAIAEVKVLTSNYQAEYGKAGGGFIQIVTKGGTRDFRGSLRYFRRHDSLNANNFFRNAQGTRADGSLIQPRQLYRYNYYGYDIGGPVYIPGLGFNKAKDKLFFFFSQEFYDQLIPQDARNLRVPTLEERNGDFSNTRDGNGNRIFLRDPSLAGTCTVTNTPSNPGACFVYNGRINVIDPARFFSNGQSILNLYPEPNVTGDNRFNYTSSISIDYPRREDILRMDWNINDSNRLTGRFINNADKRVNAYGGAFSSSINFPLSPFLTKRPGLNLSFTLFSTFSPTLTNELIVGPSRATIDITAEDENITRAANGINFPLLFNDVNTGDYIPNFTYGGVANQTFPSTGFNGLPFRADNRTLNIINNLTKIFTNHTVKAGVNLQFARTLQTAFGNVNSSINFTPSANTTLGTNHPYANALLGVYNTYSQASSFPTGDYRYLNAEFYAQDTWKVTPRLTLDYGMRFSYYEPQYDSRRQTGVFNPELFDPSRAVRLYRPVCVGTTAACATSTTQLRAIDPAVTAPPTTANTLPSNFIGLIVPNSGDIANGIGRTADGYDKGGFEGKGLLLAPRLGFAFDLTGKGDTVLRGGAGVFYDRVQGNLIFDQITNPPTILRPQLFNGRLDQLTTTGGVLAPVNVIGYAPDGDVPTIYSYSLGVQRNVGFGVVVDLSYVGTSSRHLAQQRNLNAIPYLTTFQRSAQDPTRYANGVIPTVEPNLPLAYNQAGFNFSGANALQVNFLRPYQGYGDILYREFVGTSNYNSLQFSANKRFNKGFNFGVAYTFSKVFVTANNDSNETTNSFDVRRYDYKLADFDRTHIFVVNYQYELPKFSRFFGGNPVAKVLLDNIMLTGISQYQSGTPYELNVSIQGINAGQRITGSYTEQPRFFLRDGANPSAGANGAQINPDAFILPGIGNVGPYPRTYLRTPATFGNDISIFKNIPFGGEGRRYLQLRLELFNVFNQTIFSDVNTSVNVFARNATDTADLTGNAIFGTATDNAYVRARLNRTRQDGDNSRLGTVFGDYDTARPPRIIQLGIKLYF